VKMNLTAPVKPPRKDPGPYVNHVGMAIAEVFPAIVAYNESGQDFDKALILDSRLAELEHACQMARRVL